MWKVITRQQMQAFGTIHGSVVPEWETKTYEFANQPFVVGIDNDSTDFVVVTSGVEEQQIFIQKAALLLLTIVPPSE